MNSNKKSGHIYAQVQHRSKIKFLNKEMKKYIATHHPELTDENMMVEIHETKSFELNNSWIADEEE